jgi:hypothetical protein
MNSEGLPHEQDPVEAYKQEFKGKKAEERRFAAERKLRLKSIEFKILRWLSLPILLFGIFLLLDYWLPSKIYEEEAITGWEETRGRRSFKTNMGFMQTQTFAFDAPVEVERPYDYEGIYKPLIHIEATPFLKTVKSVSVTVENELWEWSPEQTIYNNVPFLPYLITLSALFTWVRKEFTPTNYWLSLSPPLLLIILVLIAVFGV